MTDFDVVTGAFSYSGAVIASELQAAGHRVRTLTGHPGRAPAGTAIEVRPLDFADPAGLAESLRGARALVNTYWVRFAHGQVSHEIAVARSRVLFQAAAEAGVRRVVHVSITHPDADSPYPYFRGLICDIGFEQAHIEYTQARRRRGVTKNNFYTLYDMAMLGITNHSKVPLRIATIFGFAMSALGFLLAFGYLIAKLALWNKFSLGTAPILIGFFLFSSIQLFFIGILGEYIGAIHTQVLKRPLVVEKERINF